ncbi:histone-fold-containing protein [Phycomyces nitens]|nr:histone-fold-containing protein [Phycomyces nitens]
MTSKHPQEDISQSQQPSGSSIMHPMPTQQFQPQSNTTAPVVTAPGGHPIFNLTEFWQEQMATAENFDSDFKNHPLPLARIKKVMKTDQDVKMISAEAPILFAKGCEIFIAELTRRAWVHAEENKRRTLQRSDIATAISKTDMCDFLIDIVPREEAAKAADAQQTAPVYDQAQYANYYQSGMGQYAQTQQLDHTAYYPQLSQLTPEQVHQYQIQLQQLATHHPYAAAPGGDQSQIPPQTQTGVPGPSAGRRS